MNGRVSLPHHSGMPQTTVHDGFLIRPSLAPKHQKKRVSASKTPTTFCADGRFFSTHAPLNLYIFSSWQVAAGAPPELSWRWESDGAIVLARPPKPCYTFHSATLPGGYFGHQSVEQRHPGADRSVHHHIPQRSYWTERASRFDFSGRPGWRRAQHHQGS